MLFRSINTLEFILDSYTKMAQGMLVHNRFAIPLGTGLGKTSSIVAWVAELYHQGYNHISVAICASQIEALCQLKRDLMAEELPDKEIGLWHTYDHNEAYEDIDNLPPDRKSVVEGKSVDLGGRSIIKKKKRANKTLDLL